MNEMGAVSASKSHNLGHAKRLKIQVHVNQVTQPNKKISNFRIAELARSHDFTNKISSICNFSHGTECDRVARL